jgi:PleD family two-component response regulator
VEFTPYTLPLIAATAFALGLAFFVLKYRRVPGRMTFALPPGLRVLVVDDNVVNQRMTSALLESHGHTVTVVDDGQEAVEALAALRPR